MIRCFSLKISSPKSRINIRQVWSVSLSINGWVLPHPTFHQPPSGSNKVIRRTVLCLLSSPLKAVIGSPPHTPPLGFGISHTRIGTLLHSGAAYALFAAVNICPKSLRSCCSGITHSSDDRGKADQSYRALPPACRSHT